MSFTSDSIPMHRKRIATERLTENGDPLIANKKACEAAKKTPAQQVSYSSGTLPSTDTWYRVQ